VLSNHISSKAQPCEVANTVHAVLVDLNFYQL